MAGRIVPVDMVEQMPKNFIDYAMSVIVSRALPDVRDGLKPVHRRILYAMNKLGFTASSSYRKSATTVGEVLGRYHPHGDTAVYDTMVRMAQDFSFRYPLVDGHGNFGSVDGDGAAAMRYTEARMTRLGQTMLQDIEKNTVDFGPNYDGKEIEPLILPSLIPNLLVNGVNGIAVGMATLIPPHNLNDAYNSIDYIIDATLAGEEPELEKVVELMNAPDFPTGGKILGIEGVKKFYRTGRGKIVVQSKYHMEIHKNGKQSIVVTEIPYQVNKAATIEKIAELVKEKKVEGITDIRDESDRDGMRMVIDLKRDVEPQPIVNYLMKHTELQTSYGGIMLALVDGQPRIMDVKTVLEHFIVHAATVIQRRTQYNLDVAAKRLGIVEAVLKALDQVEEVIRIIREEDDDEAQIAELLDITAEQAEYVANLKLKSLKATSEAKFNDEAVELVEAVRKYTGILNDDVLLLTTLKEEFAEIRKRFGDERRTEVQYDAEELDDEDFIKEEMLVVTMSSDYLIKTVEEKEYKTQARGGKGVKAANTKDDEIITNLLTVNSKDDLLFFSDTGRCHVIKAYKIPKSSRTARGKSLNNYLKLDEGEKIITMLSADLNDKNRDLLFITKYGTTKRLNLTELSTRLSVTRVIDFKDGDSLVKALIVTETDNVIITTRNGKSLRIALNGAKSIRPMGRKAAGVIGITLNDDDYVVDMDKVEEGSTMFVISEGGYGKKTNFDQYPTHNRGGQGVIGYNVVEKTGNVVASMTVKETDELFVATEQSQIVRINVKDISTLGRATSGVKIMNLNEGDKIVSISKGESDSE